ncbi:MAG: N-6 DNA methylase, partial [Anaerolineae bacterium]|nr:N-6 DNA methylase [Anaerolineae bacterium]
SLAQLLGDFFRGFDATHDSALFAPDMTDRTSFGDDVLMPLIEKLYEARYRSMPADIIGNTYEQYLGKILVQENGAVVSRDNLETRKKQGTYYTPQVIVRYLVDNSLGRYLYGTQDGKPDGEPAAGATRKTAADIRDLRVLDSACGSGSFLIYAYEVLADFYERELQRMQAELQARVAALARQGETIPLEVRFELATLESWIERLRDYPRLILETHLYGVDLDPQAAEIATVNLMMRAMERRHHEKRLPLILDQNVKVGNSLIGLRPDDPRMAGHAGALAEVRRLRLALVETPNGPAHDRIIENLEAATAALNAALDAELAGHFTDPARVRPFHWAAEFPEVFVDAQGRALDNPGFTIIVGNPPWETVKPDLREYYAQFDPDIESKLTRRQVERRIKALNAEDPRRAAGWEAQTQLIEESAAYFRAAPDYTRQGRGDTATHKLFLERIYSLLRQEGRIGYIVPSGIYTDLGTKELREMLLNEGQIQYIFSFSNERFFFPGVHHAFKFALLGAQKGPQSDGFWATFRINPRVAIAPEDLLAFLSNPANLIYVRCKVLPLFNPHSLSVMEFPTRRDYEAAEAIYNDWPLLGDEVEGLWDLEFSYEFHMSNDSKLFNQTQAGLPLYEGKMIYQFDSYFTSPRYWIEESQGTAKLKGSRAEAWFRGYRFAFREVSGAVNERTCIAAVLPPNTFAGHTLWVGVAPDYHKLLYYVAMVNSLCVDWIARFKVMTHVTLFVMKSLPIPRLSPGSPYFDAIVPRAARLTCTRAEFADLWQAVMGEPWDATKGATAPAERQRLRDEIDAIVAHLYGLSRDDFDHILCTFPLVFPDTEAGWTKREALLRVYDEWVGRLSR